MCIKKLITFLFCAFFLLQKPIYSMNNDIFTAIRNDDIKKVKWLLNYGVNVNCRHVRESNDIIAFLNPSNYTPLISAAGNEKTKITKLLLNYGANTSLVDDMNRTACSWAQGRHEILMILSKADNVKKLIKDNRFDELYKVLAKEPIHDRYLLGYSLFQFRSKKQFEQFKHECKKNGIKNLEQLIYRDISPRLLCHFLKLAIWTWDNKMFSVFSTLFQKKEMLSYQFNEKSIARVPCSDIKIYYNRPYA